MDRDKISKKLVGFPRGFLVNTRSDHKELSRFGLLAKTMILSTTVSGGVRYKSRMVLEQNA